MYSVEGNERIVASEDRKHSAGHWLVSNITAAPRFDDTNKRSRSLLSAYIICAFSIFECGEAWYVCSSGNATPGEETSLHKRSAITDLIMVNRRRVYRGSGGKLNSGLGETACSLTTSNYYYCYYYLDINTKANYYCEVIESLIFFDMEVLPNTIIAY